MEWQRLIADVACEVDPATGRPAYREVFVTVPRQSGKTTLFLAWEIHRCLRWPNQPQRSVFTAQTGKDARDKWVDELFPQIRASKLNRYVRAINEGMGNEAVKFRNGSLIRLLSTSSSSGHSKTIHQAVMDEIWHDVDDRREQGLRPAMITVPDAQILLCSTAGTAASTVYNRKVIQGRNAVSDDSGEGMAYFEWSAPDEWDPDDEDSWWEFMPALGHTIGPEAIRTEREAMEDGEFRRAYGNKPTAGADLIIPEAIWNAACSDTVSPRGTLRYGLDLSEDRSSASIVAYGRRVIELIENRRDVGWVVRRVNELTARHGGTVAFDLGGPAGALKDKIRKASPLSGRDAVQATQTLYDDIIDGQVKFRQDPRFDQAVEGAVKRPMGDNWVFSRKASQADVTPLVAAAMAYRRPARQRSGRVWGHR